MKTTISTLAVLALFAACTSDVLGQQTYPISYGAAPMPVGRYVGDPNVSAYGPQTQHYAPQAQNISAELHRGATNGGGCTSGCCSSGCAPACGDCACNSCNHCCASKCCYGCCLHRTGGYADWLYLSPRNVDLSYAVPYDGVGRPGQGTGNVPQGDVGILDLDYNSGMRFGFNFAVDCNSSFGASYTYFDTDADDFLEVDAPRVIQSLVAHPDTFNSGFTSQQAFGAYDLEFQLIDVDYRAVLWSCKGAHVNYVVGGRYGHMESQFAALYPFATPDGTVFVGTDINFDGAGIRIGLEGERRIFRRSGLSVYSKGYVSALAGQVSADYLQVNQFNGLEVLVGWKDDRVVTISELEVGLAWQNCSGNIKVGAGYYFAIWDNMVTTPEWINSVQQVNFVDVSQDDNDTVAFDGLVMHAEFLF